MLVYLFSSFFVSSGCEIQVYKLLRSTIIYSHLNPWAFVRTPDVRREPFDYSELYRTVPDKVNGVRTTAPKGGSLLLVNEDMKFLHVEHYDFMR